MMIDKLKDIKGFENISIDYFPYMLYGVVFLVVIILIVIGLYFIRKDKNLTKQQIAIKALKSMDFDGNIKDIVYDFTIYGKITLNELYKDEFLNIVNKLEKYKYKKDIPNKIDDDLIDDMKDYIRVRL